MPDADRRVALNHFHCPLCAQPLRSDERTLRCASGHAFDVAREGYVNLLPSHHRRSARAGDSAEMVAARRAFLAAGHYAPLEGALAAHSAALADSNGTVLDVGCGEGTFTAALAGDRVHGVDISRPAIRAAALRFPAVAFAVASGKRLPFGGATFGVLCVVMAPLFDDALRVLAAGGWLLRVSPGAEHLAGLKEQVFARARPHARAPLAMPGLQHTEEARVHFVCSLDATDRAHLVAMTPMAHRAPQARLVRAIEEGPESVVADFVIDVFQRDGA